MTRDQTCLNVYLGNYGDVYNPGSSGLWMSPTQTLNRPGEGKWENPENGPLLENQFGPGVDQVSTNLNNSRSQAAGVRNLVYINFFNRLDPTIQTQFT